MMRHLAYHVVRTIETMSRVCPRFKLGCHGFGVLDKAVRSNAAYSISHDDVEDSMIVAPSIRRHAVTTFPES